ncbi:MAG: PKD domain-containing protein, partial [Candidatus Acidiferrum sp.]
MPLLGFKPRAFPPPGGGSTTPVSCSVGSCISNLTGTGVAASGGTAATTNLTFSAMAGAASYNVLRSTVSGGPYAQLAKITVTSYSDASGLANGLTYFYIVQPLNSSGTILCQSNEARVTIPLPNSNPAILSFSPSRGTDGPAGATMVTITGANLGTTAGTVTLNGSSAQVLGWSPTSVVVQIMSGTTGNLVVTVAGTPITAGVFTVTSHPPPVAAAGPGQTLTVGATAQLDGSGSVDPAGVALTYQWTLLSKPAGSLAVLSSTTAVRPTFIVDVAGEYAAQLVVTDEYYSSNPSVVVVSTQAVAPVANAGQNQRLMPPSVPELDGSQSTDANGYALTYQWSLVSISNMSAMTLSNATSVKPTVSVTEGGNFVFQLVVNNGCFYSAPSLVSVSNQYVLATANAGPNQRASVGGAVQLDGSRSTDQNDYSITYAWSLLSAPAGSTAALSSTSSVRPTFVPDQLGLYVFQLITEDGSALGYPIIPATTEVSTSELPPVAVPGAPRTVPVGTFVTLNGSASSSSNGQALTYSWSLISTPSGSSAALTSTTSATPSFTADVVGTYIAQLTVNDGFLNSTPESVEISTIDLPPIANAGPNQTVLVGSTVQLNGSGSLDFDNHALTYQWSTLSPMGGGVNSINENPTFTANTVGIYVCELIVNDGITNSLPSTVVITVYAANVPPTVSAGANQEI